MTDTAIPKKLNSFLFICVTGVFIFEMLVMPFALSLHPYAMALIVLATMPINIPFWSLIHEAIHKNFLPHRKANEWGGRFMSILFGASFNILSFGHLMHHQYNRNWESEYYSNEQNEILAWANHYFKMLGGLYLIEVLMSFIIALSPAFLSKKITRTIFPQDAHYQAVLQSVLKKENIAKIRLDCFLIVTLYVFAFFCFAQNWGVLLLLMAARAFIISIMDNSYHYGTPLDNSIPAKELRTSSFLTRFVLHFNYHLTHHNNTRLPWIKLASHHSIQQNEFSGGLGKALFSQFKGPIKILQSDK